MVLYAGCTRKRLRSESTREIGPQDFKWFLDRFYRRGTESKVQHSSSPSSLPRFPILPRVHANRRHDACDRSQGRKKNGDAYKWRQRQCFQVPSPWPSVIAVFCGLCAGSSIQSRFQHFVGKGQVLQNGALERWMGGVCPPKA